MKLFTLGLLGGLLFAQSGRQVVLTWNASTSPGVTYNVYRAAGTCQAPFSKISTAPVTALTYTDTNVAVGTYCYQVTAAAAGLESVPSNNSEAPVPPYPPSGLTISVQVAVNVQVNGIEIAKQQQVMMAPVRVN